MLNICERIDEELTTLQHGDNVFHEALEKVKEGEVRFHVTDKSGRVPDYDLAYTYNMLLFPENVRAIITKMTQGGSVYAPFHSYDENDKDNICLDFLKAFKKIEFEVIDEYSIAVARAALKYTDIDIYYIDDRLEWFVENSDKLHKVESFSNERDKNVLRVTPSPFEMGYTKRDWSTVFSLAAFQNLFFWQSFTEGQKGPFKYVEVVLTQIAGIGGILSYMSMVSNAASTRGLKAFLRPGCTRYPEKLLCKYFRVNPKPDDATEENTITIVDLAVFTTTWFCCQYPASFDESILDDNFAAEMREYAEAVLGGRKALGVLARGTDYITSNLGADRTHARVEQMIPVIREWMEEGGYEKIFLATEDQDNFDQMRKAFPGKIIAISQERMSVADMKKKGTTLIYEFEQKSNQGQEYNDALEDTTVNYFYALYILSKCDAFLCSGQCNGWDTVRSLNGGKFERERKLMVVLEGDPEIEKWKEIRPVTAGMFARGVYPTSKAFFMTSRFDLNEKVDPDAVRKAWDKTLKVYPYMSYAVATRAGKLVLLENDRPFVIEETSEVIEPFERAGNFHTVTFCYLTNTLWIYADHVPFDGTGYERVLETFFYHYYCITDGKEYSVPEGVYTEKDGAVDGTEIDAYQMVDAIDPKVMMAGMGKGDTFVLKECIRDELFLTKEDCRGYCISVPSDEFMNYAKSVKGSPMSLLSVFLARAVERVHPENKLPISTMSPVSVRKVMGNANSLLHQVVHAPYEFKPEDLEKDDATLNGMYRGFLKGFSSEQNIKTLCGVYRGICEGYAKAFAAGALDNVIIETRSGIKPSIGVSYLGTLKTAEYGNRIRMTAFHAMQEKGVMLQVTEIGDHFYIDWYQGFHGEMYAKAMRDLMIEAGMSGAILERVE
ncbi:hypothetical protein SAMN06296386_10446 [Lachnospiraceae bacterium]|nr:hypothetical protein SAMN06296386_10446 [Lachnospiraceae bacterium]